MMSAPGRESLDSRQDPARFKGAGHIGHRRYVGQSVMPPWRSCNLGHATLVMIGVGRRGHPTDGACHVDAAASEDRFRRCPRQGCGLLFIARGAGGMCARGDRRLHRSR